MNCTNCGKPLFEGSPICPVCGANNELNANTQVMENQPTTNNVVPEQPNPNTLNNNVDLDKTQLLEPISQGTEAAPASENVNLLDGDIMELDDEDEKVTITENMAPPTLTVDEENLAQGAGDLANENSVSTYSNEAITEQETEEKEEKTRQEERVDIAIPSVSEVKSVSLPSDGSAPEIQESAATVGDASNTTTVLEEPNKKKKFKLNIQKGSKNVPKNLMIIVAIIFLVVGVLLGKAFFSKNYCSTNVGQNRSVVFKNKVKYVSDGKNNTTNVGGYTYKIPEGYIYDKSDGGLLIYDDADSFRIYIKTDAGLYTDLTGAKNSIRATMVENGVNVENVRELKSNDVEFLIFETITRLNNRIIAFADAKEDHVFYLEIVNVNNGFDYDVLDIAADILKNVTPEGTTSAMEKIDVVDISDVSIRSALEFKKLTK